MKIYAMTDVGTVRAENQDCFLSAVLSPPPREDERRGRAESAVLAAVLDGMGGARGGEVASHMAADAFLDDITRASRRTAKGALKHATAAANSAVFACAEREEHLKGMGTTLAAVLAYDETIALAHVGDSRIYLYHAGSMLRLTRDHSYVQELIDAGRLAEEEARHSRHKNLITRAVGTRASVEADVALSYWEEGDKLLLCTDGLVGALRESEILSILSEDVPIERTACELIDAALQYGCDDNVTVLLIENTKEN